MTTVLLTIFAFCAGLGSDFFFAQWTKATIDKRAFEASNWSLLTYLVALCYTLMIVNEKAFMIGAYIAGAYLGTYISVKWR